jgi:hypothetical protein
MKMMDANIPQFYSGMNIEEWQLQCELQFFVPV